MKQIELLQDDGIYVLWENNVNILRFRGPDGPLEMRIPWEESHRLAAQLCRVPAGSVLMQRARRTALARKNKS
jgi:hypothetical protein